MQCCGEPFRVGGQVQWSTTRELDTDYFSELLGPAGAAALTDYEDHHDLDVGPMAPLVGTVERIEAIFCQYGRRGQALYPIAGTTRVDLRDTATGWESEHEDEQVGLRFVGYVVTVASDG